MLDNIGRVRFVCEPTPIERLDRLGERIGCELLIKRDDLTGLAGGGNKARKLEYLVYQALSQGCDRLVTIGAVQSNHARMTAAAACRFGLGCDLVLEGDEPSVSVGNLLLDRMMGARITWCEQGQGAEVASDLARSLERQGYKPYLIPVGGSTAHGVCGYVRGMWELSGQLWAENRSDVTIVCATGSGGTQAGMVLGAHLFCPGVNVVGISVSRNESESTDIVWRLVEETADLLQVKPPAKKEVVVDDRFVGPGYAAITPECLEAVRLSARQEGLLLDPVYTGKAMAGLLSMANNFKGELLFWHTGGSQALSAHPQLAEL